MVNNICNFCSWRETARDVERLLFFESFRTGVFLFLFFFLYFGTRRPKFYLATSRMKNFMQRKILLPILFYFYLLCGDKFK